MTVMQKLKFMQEFTLAINEECLQNKLLAKLLMQGRARAKHAKTRKCSIHRDTTGSAEWKLRAQNAHIGQQNLYHMSDFSKSIK